MFNRQQGGHARGGRRLSAFREALLARGHGEWAFHADGRHVRVAREAPLRLSSLNPVAAAPEQANGLPIVFDDRESDVRGNLETGGTTGDTVEAFAPASPALASPGL